MSGFFGIFRPQGGSVDLEAFEQMRKATEREGFDGMETHVEEKIAMGHLMLRVSPESKYDKQPLKSSCGNYLLVGHFRLDYRDELGDKLGLTQSELEITPDSQLVMLSYQKWKSKCVNHIEGDWAFVVYSKTDNSIFFAKDQMGYSALFYSKYNNVIYFSSDLQVLAACKSIPKKIDLEQLFRISLPGVSTAEGKTLLKFFYSVRSSYWIKINVNLSINEQKYSELFDNFKLVYSHTEDYVEDLRSLYSRAVSSCVKSTGLFGVLLSSGLDSSSVAYFSSRSCKKESDFFYTFTSFPFYLNEIPESKHYKSNEAPYVKKFVETLPNVIPLYFDFPQTDYKELLNSELTSDYLNPILHANTFWLEGINIESKKLGIKSIFSGQMGNFTISWNAPFIYLELLFLARLSMFYKSVMGYSFLKKIFFLKVIYQKTFRLFYDQLRGIFRNLVYDKIKKNHSFSDLNKDLIKKKLINVKGDISFISGYTFFHNSLKTRKFLLLKSVNMMPKVFQDFHRNGLIFVDPTSNIRLTKFSFSIKEELFNYLGQEKFIYKEMMKKENFPFILEQDLRIPQSADIGFRLINNFKAYNFFKKDVESMLNSAGIENLFNEISSRSTNYLQKRSLSTRFLKKISLQNFILKNLLNFDSNKKSHVNTKSKLD